MAGSSMCPNDPAMPSPPNQWDIVPFFDDTPVSVL